MSTNIKANPSKIDDDAIPQGGKVQLQENVTIGLSAYGNAEVTFLALRSLFYSATGDFELILIDDCSPDQGATLSVFKQAQVEHKNSRIFAFTKNQEYTGSLNAILSHARGDKILFVSNDIFVTPSYLRQLLLVSEQSGSFGIVRGRANFVDDTVPHHSLPLLQKPQNFAELYELAAKIEREDGGGHTEDAYLVGDAFLTSRSLINKIGTIDPFFFGYYGDGDFGIRAKRAGFEIVTALGAFAYHNQDTNFFYLAPAEREKKVQTRWGRVFENWARFKIKYGLPVDLALPPGDELPWEALSSVPFYPDKDVIAPGDYSQYILPPTK